MCDILCQTVSSGTWHMAHVVCMDDTQLGGGPGVGNPSRAKQLQVQTLVVMSAVNSTSPRRVHVESVANCVGVIP